jgi:hypothetical protein
MASEGRWRPAAKVVFAPRVTHMAVRVLRSPSVVASLLSLVVVLTSTGCQPPPGGEGSPHDEPSAGDPPARAEGTEGTDPAAGLDDDPDVAAAGSPMSTAELSAAIAALDVAIAELRSHIHALEDDIAALEAENAAKAAEIDRLVKDIEARTREVEEQYERDRRNALLFCWVGYCNVGAVSLVMALENDARLKSLKAQLAAAKAEQQQVHADLAEYRSNKDELDGRLAALRKTEATLMVLLATDDSAPSELLKLARRADRMVQLKDNLGTQATTLAEVKTLAAQLSAVIDDALAKVAVAAQKAERLAEASRKATFKLLEILTAGSPEAAAQKWLDQWVAKKTKDLLREIGWDPDGFVDHLVSRTFPGQEQSPAAKLLRDKLRKALRGK